MSREAIESLQAEFPDWIIETHAQRGDETALIRKEGLHPMVEALRDRLGFDMLVDICGNDYPERADRFETIYHFLSTETWKRVRLRVPLPAFDPVAPSLVKHFQVANWYEREVWDMYGIRFEGHPDLRRILTHHQFVGHPLRKDYPKEHRQYLDEPVTMEECGIVPHELDDGSETITLNLGPAHPIMHGIIRLMAELDGELIINTDVEIGYLHRCMEKESESHTWAQIMPYTDRLNYVSAPNNTVGYAMAVEKLAGVDIPLRSQWIRVMLCELGRIMDHCTCLGPAILDLGALTNYWYFFQIREACYRILDKLSGSRLTNTYVRIGGVAADLYDGFAEEVRALRPLLDRLVSDVEGLVAKNRIFLDRTLNVGVIGREEAIDWGLSGPVARAAGLAYDVRKAAPYYHYDEIDFEMVVGSNGDSHDRLLLRMQEMRQSMRILEQVLEKLEPGPINAEVRDVVLPSREDTYTRMESMISHFNIIYRGAQVPAGEAYGYTEGANGELGYYLVSEGGGHPQRIHVHPPCFSAMQVYGPLCQGLMIQDAVAILGTLNIIAGELDR